MDLVLGDETKKAFRKVERGLEVMAGSEMPSHVAVEAGRLMMEVADLQAKLKRLNDEASKHVETTMWPVL